jgi:hypothetical protein
MTLAEAIAHVIKLDGCDRRSALEQLCLANREGKIRSEWEERKWWDLQGDSREVRISDAKVRDRTGDYRTVLVLKGDVFRIWARAAAARRGAVVGLPLGPLGDVGAV